MFIAIRDREVIAHATSIPALKDAVLDALGDDATRGTFRVYQTYSESFRFEQRLVCVHDLGDVELA